MDLDDFVLNFELFYFLLLFVLFMANMAAAAGPEILAIRNIDVKPYADALDGFKTTCDCRVNQIFVAGLTDIDIMRKVHMTNPDIILAIGRDALLKVKCIKDKPVIYMMVHNPQSILST